MKWFAGCIALALLTIAPAAAAPGEAKEGKAVFDSHCKSCHGADGQGNPAIAKMLKVTLHPLSSAEVQSKSDEELRKDITQGVGKMKPVRGLSADQVNDVIAYIRSLKK